MLEKVVIHPNNPYDLVLHDPETFAIARQQRTVLESIKKDVAVPIADTFGWDTVFAIRLPDLNNALCKPNASPGSFSQDMGNGYHINGTFGFWQVKRGGDGKNLQLSVPIHTGTMGYNNTSTVLDGATAIVEIALNYLPPPQKTHPTKSGSTHQLKANAKGNGPEQPPAAVIDILPPQGKSYSIVGKALIQGALNTWFNENLSEFEHVFSVVNLNLLADKASFQWLKPSNTGYAYADGNTDENSFFGVLCTTEERSIDELTHEISSAAIPTGARAGFLINSKIFLRDSVLGGIPKAFDGAKSTDFQLTSEDSEITKAPHATVKLKPVNYGGEDYMPYVESFSLQINDTEIVTHMEIKVTVFPGVDSIIDMTYYHTLELVNKPDGSQTIGFKQVRQPQITHTKHVAAGVKVTFVILEILGAVVGALTGGAGDIVEFIITAVIIAIIVGVIEGIELLITDVLTNGVANSMPAINPLIYAGTDPITWPTQQSKFKLTSVNLNGAVQFGGDPNFAT